MTIFTIPKTLTRKGDLVLIPKKEYERLVQLSRMLSQEEQDIDEAIRIFERERRGGKLKSAHDFSSILRVARRHA